MQESAKPAAAPHKAQKQTDITWRGILVGCLMCAIIAIGAPYARQIIQGTSLALSSATPAAFFVFFVLLISVHVLMGMCRRRWSFQRGELITVFIMMMVTSAIATKGVTALLLPMITGTFYYATMPRTRTIGPKRSIPIYPTGSWSKMCRP